MNFDTLYVNPNGRTAKADYIPALIVLVAAIAFFGFVVTGRTAHFCMLVLMYPTFVLLARRLNDMGYSRWLALLPLALQLSGFGIILDYFSMGSTLDTALPWLALVVSGAFGIWASIK